MLPFLNYYSIFLVVVVVVVVVIATLSHLSCRPTPTLQTLSSSSKVCTPNGPFLSLRGQYHWVVQLQVLLSVSCFHGVRGFVVWYYIVYVHETILQGTWIGQLDPVRFWNRNPFQYLTHRRVVHLSHTVINGQFIDQRTYQCPQVQVLVPRREWQATIQKPMV
jgi:hypothetical protein